MKKILLLVAVLVTAYVHAQTNVFPSTGAAGIGTLTPNSSSLLDVTSTTKGILIPRMTGAQRNAIVSPATGLLVYQTNGVVGFYYYSGTAWTAVSPKGVSKSLSNLTGPTAVNVSLLPATSAAVDLGDSSLLWRNAYFSGNVGIGTGTPGANLDVKGSFEAGTSNGALLVFPYAPFKNTTLDAVFFGTTANPQLRFTGTSPGFVDIGQDSSGSFTVEGNDTPRFTVTQGGNVGIGKSAPVAKLDVAGSVNLTDSLTISGDNGVFYIDNTGTFAAKNSSGTYENYFWPRWSDNRTIINYGTGNFEIRNNASTVTMTLTNGNRVGIGTGTPAGQFELSLDQGRKPSTSTWTIASDERLKNIDGAYTKGLKEILQLKPILYHYKNAGNRKFDVKTLASQAVGFTAQDVQKIFPECVSKDEDGYLNLNIHAILVAQVNAIQQLSAENDALKSTLEKQQQQINAILQKLNEVQSAQQACCNQTSVAQTGNNASITLNSNDIASLKQNAPNPFNSTTVINYTLPQHVSNAQIKITDVKGNTIKTATVSTSGSLTVAAGSLASGTYKYSLLVDGKLIDTKTMVLTK